MIDCLSNPAWINPQTDFLLFLQSIRMGHSANIDKLFLSITVLGEYWLPTVICAITYWCIDSKAGMYLFSLEGFNALISHFAKMVACVYRPWVLDNRIQPSALAMPYAKGYSFPSGHSCMSSSIFGGLAFLARHKKLLSVFLIALFLLVGFSRLWLGVHTPQDVLGGFLIGITMVFAVHPLIEWAEKDKNRYLYILGAVNLLSILSLIYIKFFNTCRIDYVDGVLLVDPHKAIYTTLVVYAYALGLLNGCFLCRRFFPFNPKEVSIKRRVARGIVGVIGIFALLRLVLVPIFMNLVDIKIAISAVFLTGIAITLIYPIIFTKINFEK